MELENGVRVTCDVGYLYANFSLPRPLCSLDRPDVRDRQTDKRQTDVRQKHRLMPPPYGGRGIMSQLQKQKTVGSSLVFSASPPRFSCLSISRIYNKIVDKYDEYLEGRVGRMTSQARLGGRDPLKICRRGQSMFRLPKCHILSFKTVVG